MNGNEFYKVLSKLKTKFKWQVDENNNIVATRGNDVYNPITAIGATVGYSAPSSNKRESLKLARALGLDRTFSEHVYDAANCLANRGQAQIVRGRMRSVLGL
jgi:hypothetical protein